MKSVSTVLFLNDHPVGYRVIEEKSNYLFFPASVKSTLFETPAITAIKRDKHWIVEGTNDISLIQQVQEACAIMFPNGLLNDLHAAP
ncbi:MAG TPA: hypothetical protein VEY32_01890 [Flavisolibacter sp.]|jgi:hypothetical protein|nr:hypothetical protein [Flavisolibacter sp.]